MTKRFIPVLLFIMCLVIGGCGDNHSQSDNQQPERAVNTLSFASTTDEIQLETDQLLIELNQELTEILAVQIPTFNTFILPLNDLLYRYQTAHMRNTLLLSAAETAEVRDAAQQSNNRLGQWFNDVDENNGIAQTIAQIPLPSTSEQITLVREVQSWFTLVTETSAEVNQLNGQINDLSLEFRYNLYNAVNRVIVFSPQEMEGVTEWLLADFERDTDGNYLMLSYNYTHLIDITFNAIHEESRRKAYAAYLSLGQESNPQILEEILRLRTQIAHLTGYESHAERILNSRMVKTPANALAFLEELGSVIEQPAQQELAQLLQLKIEETNNPDAILNYWDMSYYNNKLLRLTANDAPEPVQSPLFTIDSVLVGIFDLCEELFSLHIVPQQIPDNQNWHEDVRYYVVEDADSGQPLGSFYLDLYPRDGKYNHFALFPIELGNTVADGSLRHLPVVAMLGNFSASTAERPVYLQQGEIDIIFHEAGHLMHDILYAGKSGLLSGASTPIDFIEVPSTLLQKAAHDPEVLLRSCTNNQDGVDPFSFEMMQSYLEFIDISDATNTRIHIGFSLFDIELHSQTSETNMIDSVALGNETMANYYVPVPDESAWSASFSHLVAGYDATYYCYLWSDAIASDLVSIFQDSPQGFYDPAVGKRLREEVFAPGSSRDVNESVREFLGREWNFDAYLDSFTQ